MPSAAERWHGSHSTWVLLLWVEAVARFQFAVLETKVLNGGWLLRLFASRSAGSAAAMLLFDDSSADGEPIAILRSLCGRRLFAFAPSGPALGLVYFGDSARRMEGRRSLSDRVDTRRSWTASRRAV